MEGDYQFSQNCDFNGNQFEHLGEIRFSVSRKIYDYSAFLDACGKECKSNPKCNYFTFNMLNSTCFLKRPNFFAEPHNSKHYICGFIAERKEYIEEIVTEAEATALRE